MGSGAFTLSSYSDYAEKTGKSFSTKTLRASGQVYRARRIDKLLDPKQFLLRECVNSAEHPNTIPVILALDVTGSMGSACKEVAEALALIITNLYKKYKDVEFCVMGIGDLVYDDAPIQMSQFESDIRIAEALDKIWMEHGGGSNPYESYTAAWYMGLYRTKLDCFDLQGRKGIIITMGDEPLNPYLPKDQLNEAVNGSEQGDIETKDLFKEASKKFDIFHIAVDSPDDCYWRNKSNIEESWTPVLGDRLKTATVNELSSIIEKCIEESLQSSPIGDSVILDTEPSTAPMVNENGEISW